MPFFGSKRIPTPAGQVECPPVRGPLSIDQDATICEAKWKANEQAAIASALAVIDSGVSEYTSSRKNFYKKTSPNDKIYPRMSNYKLDPSYKLVLNLAEYFKSLDAASLQQIKGIPNKYLGYLDEFADVKTNFGKGDFQPLGKMQRFERDFVKMILDIKFLGQLEYVSKKLYPALSPSLESDNDFKKAVDVLIRLPDNVKQMITLYFVQANFGRGGGRKSKRRFKTKRRSIHKRKRRLTKYNRR
jgi:hypothetical protein